MVCAWRTVMHMTLKYSANATAKRRGVGTASLSADMEPHRRSPACGLGARALTPPLRRDLSGRGARAGRPASFRPSDWVNLGAACIISCDGDRRACEENPENTKRRASPLTIRPSERHDPVVDGYRREFVAVDAGCHTHTPDFAAGSERESCKRIQELTPGREERQYRSITVPSRPCRVGFVPC